MNIGPTIRELREQKHLSQSDLAEMLHVTRQAVSNWETNKNEPDLETLKTMSGIFDVEIAAILGSEAEDRKEQPLPFREQLTGGLLIKICLLGIPAVLTLLNWLFLLPKLAADAQKTYRTLPYFIDRWLVLPVGCVFIGMLIAVLIMTKVPVRPERNRRIILLVIAALLLAPWVLGAVGFFTWGNILSEFSLFLSRRTSFLFLGFYCLPVMAGFLFVLALFRRKETAGRLS